MISLYDVLEAANGQLFGEPNAQLFTGFCLDVRLVRENDLFVARKTDYGDTHQHIAEAAERGATGILCNQPPDFDTRNLSVIIVKDPETALMRWSHYILGKLGTTVVAVTGSSGKSVTVDAINRVLATRYKVFKPGDDIADMGRLYLPLALARLRAEDEFVALPVSASQPGEIAEMIQAMSPDVGVVTHLGHAHTDVFNSLEHVAQETGLLLEYLSPTGLAVLNYDDDMVRKMSSRTRASVLTVGTQNFGADLMAYNIVVGLSKTGFDLRYRDRRFVGRWTPLLGRHQLYSVLSALAVGIHFGIDFEDIFKALSEMPILPGHVKPLVGVNGALLVDDSYDATPQSTLFALDWLESVREEVKRTIFIMGDMDHLGDYEQRGHRSIGQRAVNVVDVLVTEGGRAAQVGRAAIDQGMARQQIGTTYSIQDAVTMVKERFQPGPDDLIYVKGGAGARMENAVRLLLDNEQDAGQLVRQHANWQMVAVNQPSQTTWVDVDKSAIAHNVRLLRQMVPENVALMAVVKSDAYGHGAIATAMTALANGASYLGVSSLTEALELRDAGIVAPILVLSYTPVHTVRQAIRHGITLTMYDIDMARSYNQVAREMDSRLKVHVKIDTGMGRMGVLPEMSIAFFRNLLNLRHLDVEGVFTHFSMSDEDPVYTAEQLRVFKGVVNPLRGNGFNFKYIHAANSAAILTLPDSFLDMVRAGVALYGLSPSETVPIPADFRPAMSWKTVVAQVKTLPADHPVGYGQTFRTTQTTQVAVLPVGYAHGLRRMPYNWGEVLVHGQRAPIIGRVSMEKSSINISHIPNVTIGDEVVLLGKQGNEEITADDVGRRLGTNNYEVVCSALARVPRR